MILDSSAQSELQKNAIKAILRSIGYPFWGFVYCIIKSIKICKRAKMFKYSLAAAVNICVALGISLFLHIPAGISFEVAYFSTLLVVISSCYALQKRLAKELESIQQQAGEQDKQDQATNKGIGISKFMLGVRLSFGLYRLLSYIVLGFCVVVLIDLRCFHIVGYVAGVLVCLCSVIILRMP